MHTSFVRSHTTHEENQRERAHIVGLSGGRVCYVLVIVERQYIGALLRYLGRRVVRRWRGTPRGRRTDLWRSRLGRWEWETVIANAIATDSVGWLCKEGKDLGSQDGGGSSGSVLDLSCRYDYGNGKHQQVSVEGDCDCDFYPL
jgi:hypothetical protein